MQMTTPNWRLPTVGEMRIALRLALVLLLAFFFWIVVPLFIISLFFGFRYRFCGNEMGKEPVNKVMDSAADTVEDIKKNFTGDKQ